MENLKEYSNSESRKFFCLAILCVILSGIALYLGLETKSFPKYVLFFAVIISIIFAIMFFIFSSNPSKKQTKFNQKYLSESDNEVIQNKDSVIKKYKNLGLIVEDNKSRKD